MSQVSSKSSLLPIFRSRKRHTATAALIAESLSFSSAGLALSELHADLFTRFRYRISYQGVRKIALGLVTEGILKRANDKFSLNKQWLLKARMVIDRMLSAVSQADGTRKGPSLGDLEVYYADSLFSCDTLWGEVLLQLCEEHKAGSRNLLCLDHYAFWMPINTGRETELFSRLLESGWRIDFVFSRHTKLNDWAVEMYKSIGVGSYVTSVSSLPDHLYYNVLDDWLIEVALDPKLAALAKLVSAKKPGQMSVKELVGLSQTKGQAEFKVFRNNILADSLRRLVHGRSSNN
jgi:hypothetical protein